jgi:hypothetical protein
MGGVYEWIRKGSESNAACIEAVYERPDQNLSYMLSFASIQQRFEIIKEVISDHKSENVYYDYNEGHPFLGVKDKQFGMRRKEKLGYKPYKLHSLAIQGFCWIFRAGSRLQNAFQNQDIQGMELWPWIFNQKTAGCGFAG